MNPIIEASSKRWGLPYTRTTRDPWKDFSDALSRKRTQKKLDYYASRQRTPHINLIQPNIDPYIITF